MTYRMWNFSKISFKYLSKCFVFFLFVFYCFTVDTKLWGKFPPSLRKRGVFWHVGNSEKGSFKNPISANLKPHTYPPPRLIPSLDHAGRGPAVSGWPNFISHLLLLARAASRQASIPETGPQTDAVTSLTEAYDVYINAVHPSQL